MIKSLAKAITPAPLWELTRRAWVRSKTKAFHRRTVYHRYGKSSLYVVIADGLGKGWYDHDWDEPAEIALLRRGRLREGAVVFDLGAHQGVVAMMLAGAVGSEGRVVAVEGIRHNCEVAKENARINGFENLTVRNAVVADQPGEVRFLDGLNGAVTRDGFGTATEAVTVEGLAAEYGPPMVVFIDVEGYEQRVLTAAGAMLASDCDWFVEVHADCGLEIYGGSVAGVLKHFPPDRYDRYLVMLDTDEPPVPLAEDATAPQSRFGLVALKKGRVE